MTDNCTSEYERTRLLRAYGVLDSAVLSLQQLAAKYEIEADPAVIARSIENARKLESLPFEDAKQLYFTVCIAAARGADWGFPAETISALLIVRDALKKSMGVVAESAGKWAEYEAAERKFMQYMDDYHNPDAPLKEILDIKPRERSMKALRSLLKEPKTTARAIEAMERQGLDASDIKRLATKYRDPEDLEKALRDAERLQLLGVEEFSRREVAATRKAALRWAVKALGYVGVIVVLIGIVIIIVRLAGR